MTTAIAYAGGSYGTYVEWCLTVLSSNDPIVLPFGRSGNSHNFSGNQLLTVSGCKRFNQHDTVSFVRFHPKTHQGESLKDNLNQVCNDFNSVIYLYPDPGSILLSINNQYTKIWESWWHNRLEDPAFKDNLCTGWDILPSTPVSNIPTWVLREILSFNLLPSWQDELEWQNRGQCIHPKCITVLLNDLLYDFENTISSIQKFCNLDFKRPITDLLPAHYTMLALQKYLGQDQLCNSIVACTVNDQYIEFGKLPLPSEAWIQWQLRNLGYELRCNGLDTFPTNSVQLKKLLYTV